MSKGIKAINHGTGKIDLNLDKVVMMRPTEIHLRENGSIKEEPSFAIVMESPYSPTVVGAISLEMLNEGLADIGYKLVKT